MFCFFPPCRHFIAANLLSIFFNQRDMSHTELDANEIGHIEEYHIEELHDEL